MKLNQKRIKNNDFEQIKQCNKCHSLFWAKSEYELGNWEDFCSPCKEENKTEQNLREQKIKEQGIPIIGHNGQIKGWSLNGEKLYNQLYEPSEKEVELKANGFAIL